MQSAILDDKILLTCIPRRKQDAQNGSTMLGFGRHLRDFVKYVNHGMPAEEARFGINLADFYYIMRHIILARLWSNAKNSKKLRTISNFTS